MHTKKKLGQYILHDSSVTRCIVDAIEIKTGDTIIEIGPGTGFLTKALLEEKLFSTLIAIEKDERFARNLKDEIQDPRFEIIKGDALEILKKPFLVNKIVGNIPYYITGRLLRILSELKKKPERIVLMTQKEVAERIEAVPPKTTLLSAITNHWAHPRILKIVPPGAFTPQPQVESAVILLKPKELKESPLEFYKFLRILFTHPRKTILNNLKTGEYEEELIQKALKSAVLTGQERGGSLSEENFNALFKGLSR